MPPELLHEMAEMGYFGIPLGSRSMTEAQRGERSPRIIHGEMGA